MKQHHLSCVLAITALICSTYSKTFSQQNWHITDNNGTNAANNLLEQQIITRCPLEQTIP